MTKHLLVSLIAVSAFVLPCRAFAAPNKVDFKSASPSVVQEIQPFAFKQFRLGTPLQQFRTIPYAGMLPKDDYPDSQIAQCKCSNDKDSIKPFADNDQIIKCAFYVPNRISVNLGLEQAWASLGGAQGKPDFEFVDDKLTKITMFTKSSNFEQISAAFATKYGVISQG